MISEAFSYSKESPEDKAVRGSSLSGCRSSSRRHFQTGSDLPPSGTDEPRQERRHIMVQDNNHPQNPYPGPAEPGSGEEGYPDIHEKDEKHDEHDDDHEGSPGNKALDEPNTHAPVDEDEEPSPGNSL
jgi:hypothetical protein